MKIETNLKNEWILKSKRKYYIESEKVHVGKRKKSELVSRLIHVRSFY